MPEYPDVTVYVEALRKRALGQPLEHVRLGSPFVLRTADPPIREAAGRRVDDIARLGKRIVFELEGDLFLVIHLMIAGRFHWKAREAKIPARTGLAALDFPTGTLLFTEAGTKKRASMHLVRGRDGVRSFDRGGLEVLDATIEQFEAALRRENHTLKRALTDPHLFSGIGNAYSDEILHRARLSPIRLTNHMTPDEVTRLYRATRDTLNEWVVRLRAQAGDGFPEKVTAFRPEMAVHGKYKKACTVCGATVQRIVHADNETNYCPQCQTGKRLLADRALSKLLRQDWPKSLEELEELRTSRAVSRNDDDPSRTNR